MGFTWVNIYDGESGESVADKINAAMAYLQSFADDPDFDESKWEPNGSGIISPKDDAEVILSVLAATSASIDFLTISDQIKLTAHSGHDGIKPAGFNSEGKLVTWDFEEEDPTPGFGQGGPGVEHVTSSEHSVNPIYPNIVVGKFEGAGVNHDIYLPNANTASGVEVTVRKISHEGNSVTVYISGEEIAPAYVVLDDDFGDEITTSTKGAWIKLRSNGLLWFVMADSGDWALGE